MVNRLLTLLQRVLYPGSFTIEPGRFERFLTPVIDVEHLPDRWRR